jgi:hypothetical protein
VCDLGTLGQLGRGSLYEHTIAVYLARGRVRESVPMMKVESEVVRVSREERVESTL